MTPAIASRLRRLSGNIGGMNMKRYMRDTNSVTADIQDYKWSNTLCLFSQNILKSLAKDRK